MEHPPTSDLTLPVSPTVNLKTYPQPNLSTLYMNNFSQEDLWTIFDTLCTQSRASKKKDVQEELARIAKQISALANSKM